jgi:N-acetylmuramoyl-L-alanine amidase
MIFKPDSIVCHCSATQDSGTVSWGAIRRYHVETNGWADIGYHWGVELAGTEYEALVGRAPDVMGAHCSEGGKNHDSWGICVVGDFDSSPPPHEQMVVLADRILKPLMRIHSIPPEKIFFHREFAPWKTCPGKSFKMAYLGQYIPGVRPGI